MIRFTKMHGIGNDFVMIDTLQDRLYRDDLDRLAIEMCDRRFGIGGDGLILVTKGKSAPFEMRMFNPDGSESEMCGNGIRCFAKLLQDHGHLHGNSVDVETGAGTLHLELTDDGMVKVDMGLAHLTRDSVGMVPGGTEHFIDQPLAGYQATAVSMGNPHIVIFVDDVKAIDLEKIGPTLENHPSFPKRTNIHFVQVVSANHLIQRTWERGAGITLACGTGACSVGAAGFLTGRSERKVSIDLPGGQLQIEYQTDGHVLMTGPATTVFTGDYEPELLVEDDLQLDLAAIAEAELIEHL